MDMLVLEIDQQKYENYLSSGLVNLTETRCYHYIITKMRELGDEKFSINWGSFMTVALEPSYKQKPQGEGSVLPVEEE